MNTTLKNALFAAESVAHLRGYEREILPLADLARGMDARISELEEIVAALVSAGGIMEPSEWFNKAREVLAREVKPLAPEP